MLVKQIATIRIERPSVAKIATGKLSLEIDKAGFITVRFETTDFKLDIQGYMPDPEIKVSEKTTDK